MCWGCVETYFEDEGLAWGHSPTSSWTLPPTPTSLGPLVKKIAAFYELPGCGAGGPLHIVLDDTNVEDSAIDFCIAELLDDEQLAKWTPDLDQAGRDLGMEIALELKALPSLAMRALATVVG